MESNSSITNTIDMEHLKESIKHIIIDTLNRVENSQYPDYKFDEFFKSEVYELLQYINYETFDNIYEKIKEDTIRDSKLIWRCYKEKLYKFDYIDNRHSKQIEILKSVTQPQQRTQEWHDFRKEHLTGSNSWKIFSTKSSNNQLMFEKLEPSKTDYYNKPNLNDQQPMNWGHKYEPLSIKLYEFYNDVVVEEFGCIEHANIKYLAASPDGIVTSLKNNGRMLEVKNPTTREITKIPKTDYYVQMQLQMEVCQLEECDFVETKFKEYDSYDDFENDKYKLEKGMIIVLIKNNNDLVYEYSPLFSNKPTALEDFVNDTYNKYGFTDGELEKGQYRWFKNIYWYLDIFSCILVPRNRKWFSSAEEKIKDFWSDILKERNVPNSYLKYKAKTRIPKQIIQLSKKDINMVVLD